MILMRLLCCQLMMRLCSVDDVNEIIMLSVDDETLYCQLMIMKSLCCHLMRMRDNYAAS